MATDATFPIPSTSTRPPTRPPPPPPPPSKQHATATPWCKMMCFLKLAPDPNKWMALWGKRVPTLPAIGHGNIKVDVPRKPADNDDEESMKRSTNQGGTRVKRAFSQPSRARGLPNKRHSSLWRSSRYAPDERKRYSEGSGSSSDSDEPDFRRPPARRNRERSAARSSMKNPSKSSVLRGRCYHIYSAIACSVALFTSGMQTGWSFLVMEQDMDEGEQGRFHLRINERAMILGAFYVAVFISSPPTGLLMDYLGRKTILLLSTAPSVSAWIQAITATTARELFLSRFVAGLACGIAYTAAPIYIGEISEVNLRGKLSVLQAVMLVAGMLVNVALIPLVTFQIPIALGMAFSVLFFIMFILASESPTHYVLKGDKERAHAVLSRLREDDGPKVDEEFEAIVQCANSVTKIGRGFQNVYGEVSHKRAFHALLMLSILQQFSGICVFENGIHGIFDRKDSVITVQLAAMVFKSVQLCTTVGAMLLVDSWGRRPLLLVSCVGTAITHIILFINFIVMDKWLKQGESATSWIPAIMCPIYAAFFGVGLGPIPWVLLGEMFPPVLRGTAACAICMVTNFSGFVSMKLFQEVQEYYRLDAAIWSCVMACIVAAVFVWFIIRENARRKVNDIIEDLADE